MSKARIVKRKYSEIIKIDSNVWQFISKELTDFYDERSVIIKTAEGAACQTQDLDEAYTQICRLNDSITSIKITAKSKTADTLLIFTNAHSKRGTTAEFYSECTDMMDAIRARDFFFEIAINMRLFRYYFLVYPFGFLWINFVLFSEKLAAYFVWFLFGTPAVVILACFLVRRLVRLFQHEKYILFQTDETKTKEYRKANNKRRLFIYIAYLVTFIIISLMLFLR